jgi:hypothetical protein
MPAMTSLRRRQEEIGDPSSPSVSGDAALVLDFLDGEHRAAERDRARVEARIQFLMSSLRSHRPGRGGRKR